MRNRKSLLIDRKVKSFLLGSSERDCGGTSESKYENPDRIKQKRKVILLCFYIIEEKNARREVV